MLPLLRPDPHQVSFRSYWTRALIEVLHDMRGDVSIKELSEATMMLHEDIVDTLQHWGIIKYWRGSYMIHADPKYGSVGERSEGRSGEGGGEKGGILSEGRCP
jgi:hypothetical protein